jgi:hypothetical protein
MSQAGIPEDTQVIFGSKNKMHFEPYTDEELDSDEFFWNQMKLIVDMRSMEYFNHFNYARSQYIERMSGM